MRKKPPQGQDVKPRDIEDAPWCWQSKAALRLIRESLDATNATASAIAVYVALTEIASDEQSQAFIATQHYLASRTGLSVRTVRNRLRDLEALDLVIVLTPDLRSPSQYTLTTIGNGCPTSGNGCRTIGKLRKHANLPTVEESNEKSYEEPGKTLPSKTLRKL